MYLSLPLAFFQAFALNAPSAVTPHNVVVAAVRFKGKQTLKVTTAANVSMPAGEPAADAGAGARGRARASQSQRAVHLAPRLHLE